MRIVQFYVGDDKNECVSGFFFPASACWPVWPDQSTVLFTLRLHTCTGPFNSGKAHFAGEKVRHPVRTKSLTQYNAATGPHWPKGARNKKKLGPSL